jgi:hypothetical protein
MADLGNHFLNSKRQRFEQNPWHLVNACLAWNGGANTFLDELVRWRDGAKPSPPQMGAEFADLTMLLALWCNVERIDSTPLTDFLARCDWCIPQRRGQEALVIVPNGMGMEKLHAKAEIVLRLILEIMQRRRSYNPPAVRLCPVVRAAAHAAAVGCSGSFGPFTFLTPYHHGRNNHQRNNENVSSEDPSEVLPAHGCGVAAFATEFVASTVAVRDVDRLQVLRATQRAAALAPRGRWGCTGVALRPRCCWGFRPVGMTALRAGFGFDRNLSATGRALDQRHCGLPCAPCSARSGHSTPPKPENQAKYGRGAGFLPAFARKGPGCR